MTRTRGRTNTVVAIAALVAVACWAVPDVDRRIVMPWLLCTDCTANELAKVLVYGDRVVPTLEDALREGPTNAEDSVTMLQATEAVLRARRYRNRHGIVTPLSTGDSSESVQRQLDHFQLSYRLRAAQALVRIDSLRAAALVDQFCALTTTVGQLQRRPEFRASFEAIGNCP